uniref:Chromatin modification-related protein EAF7 n=1 Tax=Araucaria cunninghamii TaxID=56994 RepID=A0A0D6R1V5_ARACU
MAESGKEGNEEASEQDGLSAHSPFQAPRSSASSLPKELPQVELELRLLEALEIYHPVKLQGMHRHFVLFGLMEYLKRRLNRHFSADEVLQLLDRFYNLEMIKPDDDEMDVLSQEEEFSLPHSYLMKDD